MNASVTGVEHLHLNMKMQFSYDIPTFDLCRCSAIQAGGESSDITIARSVMEFGVMWTWMRNARSGRRRGPAAARVPASSPARAAAAVAVVRAGSLAVRLRPPRVLHEPRAEGTGREMVGRVGSSAATVPRAAPRPGLVGIAGDSAARRRRRCCTATGGHGQEQSMGQRHVPVPVSFVKRAAVRSHDVRLHRQQPRRLQ